MMLYHRHHGKNLSIYHLLYNVRLVRLYCSICVFCTVLVSIVGMLGLSMTFVLFCVFCVTNYLFMFCFINDFYL